MLQQDKNVTTYVKTCSLRVASIPAYAASPSVFCSVLSDRFAEAGEHYFCIFYVGMKPRFGDEAEVGFHIFYHSFQVVDFVVCINMYMSNECLDYAKYAFIVLCIAGLHFKINIVAELKILPL